MSLLVLDDQLNRCEVLLPILKWAKAQFLRELRLGEQILDDRVPEILLQVKQPTFVTIDQGFWDRTLCHAGYAVLCFALADEEQHLLPESLRSVLRRPEFRSRSKRMGKVARITQPRIEWWDLGSRSLRQVRWSGPSGKG